MSFKTQKEIWEALITQKKVSHKTWIARFLHLDGGFVCDEGGDRYSEEFDYPSDWSPYEEPKKMETVTFYRYTFKTVMGAIRESVWTTESSKEYLPSDFTVLKTESKTLEIEDV